MRSRFVLLALSAAGALFATGAAQGAIIDSFATGGSPVQLASITGAGGPTPFTGIGLTGAGFGDSSRSGSLTTFGATASGANVVMVGGYLTLNMNAGTSGITQLSYQTGGAGVNLANSDSINTGLTYIDTPFHTVTFALKLQDGSGAWSNTLTTNPLNVAQDVLFFLNQFTGVDKTNITGLSFTFTSSEASDARITPISTTLGTPSAGPLVPEPTSLLLWIGFAALGLLYVSWNRARTNRFDSSHPQRAQS